MLDPEEFLSANIEEQIKMIENAEAPVHLLDVKSREISYGSWESRQSTEDYERRFWYSARNPVYRLRHYSAAASHLLYRKNFVMEGSLSNGKKVRIECGLKEMIHYGLPKSSILEVAMDYYRRGWSTEGFILSVFTHGSNLMPADDLSLEHFALKQYLNDNKSVNGLVRDIYHCICTPSTKAMLMLFERMDQEHLLEYALQQLLRRPDVNMFDFCVKHGIPVGTLHHQNMVCLLDVMPPERYEEVIDQYKKADNFKPDYAHMILKRPDLVPDHCIDERVLDSVLFSGTWELMMEIINKGFRFKDKEYRIYVECELCHNGENHSCNWRCVSANFVCLKKTGLTLDQLYQAPPKPDGVNTYFYCWYDDFDTPANDNDLYIACGVTVPRPTK